MEKNYFLGFDIGTDSIGWAVTDTEYNLLKERGHDYWGTYLFDEAQTAEGRRKNRTARRRIARKRQRIKLLQEIFAQEIAKIDFCFFERLNNSKYNIEDKAENVKYRDSLFHDEVFSDKVYFKKYPTIYHLRKAFLDKESASQIKDVRLLYLAIAHIIKNRGHFLFEGQNIKAGDKALAYRAIEKINELLSEIDENNQTLSLEKIDEVFVELCDKKKTKRDKEKDLRLLLDVKTDKTCQEIIKSMIGSKVKVQNLFGEGEYDIKDFCFDDSNFELDKLQTAFPEEEFTLICELKAVYDWAVLAQILGDFKYVSEAMCAKFDKHKQDLRELKEYIEKEYGRETYLDVFRKRDKINNYAAYVGSDKNKSFAHASKEDFYKFLKPLVKDNESIMSAIEEGYFLDKQRTNANGVIPYQVHKVELDLILENASANFPFLNDKDENGISVKEKIVMLLTFRIPYYVGPLNDKHANTKFAWVKKCEGTQHEKITPWNFDRIVDKNASEDAFIARMTNKCTYLVGEDVLPKQSLIYSEFAFLNEINNVTFKGQRLDSQARKAIEDLARTDKRKITLAVIGKTLEKAGLIEKGEGIKENFAGVDGDIKATFATYRFFKSVFGDDFDEEKCENIIKWFTIMGDAKRAAERARREYKLDDKTTKKLSGLNCSGWGRLSKTFLNSDCITTVTADGEVLTIIEAMRETGCNLMELMSQRYGFASAVDAFNEQNSDGAAVTYKTIEDMYCSPSVKRAIWRTVCLAKEIEKVEGCSPKRVFVEMARGEDKEKKRTKPRKQQLLDLYQACKNDIDSWLSQKEIADLIEEIKQTDDVKFLSEKLYLYYMQMGRCAYTGKQIGVEDLWNRNICDIDHIYPQSKLKDDSVINNKVLCYKSENATKQDNYPIASNIREKMLPLWAMWHNKGLISDEKFKRLSRCTALTQEELSDFINRQLVETRQSTKAVAQILKRIYPDTDIVYSKAGNVNDFKKYVNKEQQPRIVKVRELNDLHHAKDAYLNIVVGNVYYTRFNRNAAIYFKNHNIDSYNINRIFDGTIDGAWLPSMEEKVVATVNRNTCKVVRFTSEEKGGLFNAIIKTKGANDKLIPLKRNCPLEHTSKYGGYDNATTAYFSLVSSVGKKGKKQISLEAIPIYVDLMGKTKVFEYLTNFVELEQPEILIEKIKLNSLLKLNGAYVWLRGKTGSRIVLCNANELVLDIDNARYLKRITSFVAKQKKTREILNPNEDFDGITKVKNSILYAALVDKMANAPYCNLPSIPQQAEFLFSKNAVFDSLSEKEQVAVLIEVLHFLQCNSVQSNLSLLGGAPHAGVLLHSKKLSADEECLLITQSPTGYYKNSIDLVSFCDK